MSALWAMLPLCASYLEVTEAALNRPRGALLFRRESFARSNRAFAVSVRRYAPGPSDTTRGSARSRSYSSRPARTQLVAGKPDERDGMRRPGVHMGCDKLPVTHSRCKGDRP